MFALRLDSWAPGLKTISLMHELQKIPGVGLATAKRVVDELLDGQRPVLVVPTAAAGSAVRSAITDLGVECSLLTIEPQQAVGQGPNENTE
jgi:recombinational DNA repair protein RecR